MVKFTSAIVALAATTVSAQADFLKPCNAPYDVCGWTLLNAEFGYQQSVLEAATAAAGQDANNGTIVFDTIYSCEPDGVIEWNHHCDKGCDGAIWVPNASCRS